MLKMSIKLIQPSLIRQMIWRSLPISTKPPWFTICIQDTKQTLSMLVALRKTRCHFTDHRQTYSGLFLVTVNPYCALPIYTNEYMRMYKGRSREDTKPHIYAMADEAFRNLVEEGENQSILVTCVRAAAVARVSLILL